MSKRSSKEKRFNKDSCKVRTPSKKRSSERPVCRQSEFNCQVVNTLIEALIKTAHLKYYARDSGEQSHSNEMFSSVQVWCCQCQGVSKFQTASWIHSSSQF